MALSRRGTRVGPITSFDTLMHIETLTLGPGQSNCYILRDDRRRALVVDPGSEADRIVEFLSRHQLSVLAYLITHGHADHVSALAEVYQAHPAPIALHPKEWEWAFTPINQLPPFYETPKPPPRVERELADGQVWTDADWHYGVMETPGHSPGAVAFYFERDGVLFSGDTLFRGSIGRTDLPGGEPALLTQSLTLLAGLPDETVVYPGHGPPTTIETEKHTNYFMRHGAPE